MFAFAAADRRKVRDCEFEIVKKFKLNGDDFQKKNASVF